MGDRNLDGRERSAVDLEPDPVEEYTQSRRIEHSQSNQLKYLTQS